MTNQFRKLNQPTVLDQIWNLSRKFLYTDKKINSSVFYEFGSYLYRFKSNIDLSEGVYLKRNAILGCANPISKLTVGSNTTVGFGTIAISSSPLVSFIVAKFSISFLVLPYKFYSQTFLHYTF